MPTDLQPHETQAATVRGRGCNRAWQRLQPCVAEAATLCSPKPATLPVVPTKGKHLGSLLRPSGNAQPPHQGVRADQHVPLAGGPGDKSRRSTARGSRHRHTHLNAATAACWHACWHASPVLLQPASVGAVRTPPAPHKAAVCRVPRGAVCRLPFAFCRPGCWCCKPLLPSWRLHATCHCWGGRRLAGGWAGGW